MNHQDSEPTYHNNGFHSLNQRSDLGLKHNNHVEPTLNYWEDGNGSGSEKADAYHHMGWHSKSAEQFYNWARQPYIKSFNDYDSEPVYHSNGFHSLGQQQGKYTSYL